MRFVIVGGGRVGARAAGVLREEGHDVTIVEQEENPITRCRDRGLTVIEGDGAREEVLIEAGIETADGLGALTGDLTTNFAACMIGKHYGCRTVLRIDEDYREDIYRRYAEEVDEIIYPERLGAIGAKNAILGGNIRAIADIAQSLQIVQLTVTDDSPMRGYTMAEIQLPADATILAFGKADDALGIPDPDETIDAGDRMVVLAEFSVLSDVRQLIVGPTDRAILGGY